MKHLSSLIKKSTEILLVVVSESKLDFSWHMFLTELPKRVKVPYVRMVFMNLVEQKSYFVWIMGSHPQNLKTILRIDSEQVPWGKAEKELKRVKRL